MLKVLDALLGIVVILAGTAHILAATSGYDALTDEVILFLSLGLAIWLVGALNLLRVAYQRRAPGVRWTALFANIAMLSLLAGILAANETFAASSAWGFLPVAVVGGLSLFAVFRKG